MDERRHNIRTKAFLRACIYFNNRRSAVDCLVRELSDDGAKVVFSDAVSVPDLIELYIPQKEQTLRARVQWRNAGEMGLEFLDAAAGATTSADNADLVHRVQKLEEEVAAMRRMLRRFKAVMPMIDDDAA